MVLSKKKEVSEWWEEGSVTGITKTTSMVSKNLFFYVQNSGKKMKNFPLFFRSQKYIYWEDNWSDINRLLWNIEYVNVLICYSDSCQFDEQTWFWKWLSRKFHSKNENGKKRINRHNTLHYRKKTTKIMLFTYAAERVVMFSSSMV